MRERKREAERERERDTHAQMRSCMRERVKAFWPKDCGGVLLASLASRCSVSSSWSPWRPWPPARFDCAMASSSASDISPPSKRARKFSKGAMTQYHQYSVLVEKLHREMLYTADTVDEYMKFMESVGVDHVSQMAALRETVLTFLESSSVEQLDQISRFMAFHLSNTRKIFESAVQTAELVQHMAVSEDIPIPPHLAVLQPRPHAAAPPPVAVEAASRVESIGVRVV